MDENKTVRYVKGRYNNIVLNFIKNPKHVAFNKEETIIHNITQSISQILSNKLSSYDQLLSISPNMHIPFTYKLTPDNISSIKKNILDRGNFVILKPIFGSQGKNIEIVDNVNKLIDFNKNTLNRYVSQSFISSAYTDWDNKYINGKKANTRIYVMLKINNAHNKITVKPFIYKYLSLLSAFDNYDTTKILKNGKINQDVALTNLSLVKKHHPLDFADSKKYVGIMDYNGKNKINKIIKKQMNDIVVPITQLIKNNLFFPNEKNINRTYYHVIALDTHLDGNKKLHFIEANSYPGIIAIHKEHPGGFNDFYDSILELIHNKKSRRWFGMNSHNQTGGVFIYKMKYKQYKKLYLQDMSNPIYKQKYKQYKQKYLSNLN